MFQSTLPVWGATNQNLLAWFGFEVSIHAPRVGSDQLTPTVGLLRSRFNPRSPCGERLDRAAQR